MKASVRILLLNAFYIFVQIGKLRVKKFEIDREDSSSLRTIADSLPRDSFGLRKSLIS